RCWSRSACRSPSPSGTASSNATSAPRAQLGEEADAVWPEGRAMALDDTLELALTLRSDRGL
ncbi:MAG: hypothetical protein ACRD1T_05245, partial [Acidimicrobiia bacterium]